MSLGMPENWEQVESQAAKVEKVNPGRIQNVAQEFKTASENAGDHSAELKNAASPLSEGGVWNGPAADAFFSYVAQVASAGQRVKDKLDEAAVELSDLQQKLSELKKSINETKANAKQEIDERNKQAEQRAQQAAQAADGEGGGQDPESIREQAREQNRQTASQAAERIKSLLGQANQAIKKAQRLMKQEIGGAGGYSQVPKPGQAQSQMADTGGISNPGSAPSVGGGGAGGGGGSGGAETAVGGGGGGLGSSGGPPAGPPPGNVEQWIKEAIKILKENGIPVTEENIDQIWTIIEHESGGDPRAINDWDSNAAKGTPSKGLMQCIDPTFDSHALPGHGDIWDPVDNIIAGVRYTFDRYGSLEQHPGLESISSGGGYQPY
ncbi:MULTISPECIES: transglycosylase SLT domain-containing protein [Prauserella salsuginis group]|uniref:Transglycosylase SLT domain-containing protein n=1 Tax=Prauserella salsuginis TaxID=387889 RepID=A0ABW6G0H1_9PSEU|nr:MULTISPECIES: WXG100 family type VII secretion target [Prauserella salsuginis group]MCR3721298.1 WXG100 family type VII secretion target [Prauserella flava]MCR3734622.1 WXG100 family type VII secretion target [Prauserella salsuginis]